MRHSLGLQFSLRTLLVGMLILGASPWIYLKWREYRANHVWNSLEPAKVSRDRALVAWRTAYEAYTRDKSDTSTAAEAEARKRYYSARRKVTDIVNDLHAIYDDAPGGLERAIAIRNGKRAMAQRASGSPTKRE